MKEVLLKHNYQWHDRSFDTGIKRDLLAKIIKTLDIRHVVAISGARRSGKSYIFRQLIKHLIDSGVKRENILQVNFEDPFFISLRNDISIFENLYSEFLNIKNPAGKVYLFLDEIQNINNWQFWVRDIYDRNEHVKIFITGSNAELLSDELATHLTGRVLAFDNFPFSFTEYFKGLNDPHLPELTESYSPEKLYEHLYPYKEKLLHYIELSFKRGLFPEVAYLEDIELVKDILSQYFQNVLFRDIVRRFSIRKTKVIEQLAYYLSTNFTSIYSYRKLADAVGTNENTVKEYLSYFEKAYLFFSVDYFEYSLKKQFKRNRKIYAVDCGMRDATSFSFSKDSGRYAENTVFQMLRRMTDKVYYWYEDSSKKEIDFVIKPRNQPIAINVSYTDELPTREFEAFKAFSKIATPERYILVTKKHFERKTLDGKTIELIPLWMFVFLKLF